jgi:hypothetical protein
LQCRSAPFEVRLTEVAEGVIVAISAAGRLVTSCVVEAPLHVALSRVHDLVLRRQPEDVP